MVGALESFSQYYLFAKQVNSGAFHRDKVLFKDLLESYPVERGGYFALFISIKNILTDIFDAS